MLHESRFEPCQVCGEQSSGLHCNAVTCEACKKFFLRSIHGEHKKYKCARNRDCVMTRNTRTQCQHCRFQKCLAVGMTAKEDTQTPTVVDLFKQISCYVCGAPSSGIHFGAITCEGCKGFFRRSIKERAPSRYKCIDNGVCEVNVTTRNGCKHCRFQKCLKVGMSVDASRIGRQSNLFKHHIMLMQKSGQIPSAVLHAMSNNSGGRRMSKRRLESDSSTDNSDSICSTQIYEEKLLQKHKDLIKQIYEAYRDYIESLPTCDEQTNHWTTCMDQLKVYATCCVKFATKIKGFADLTNFDQVLLVRSSIHAVIILSLYRRNPYNWNYFNCSDEELLTNLNNLFPVFAKIQSESSEILRCIERLFLDSREFSLLLALLIISTANKRLLDIKHIENAQNELTHTLLEYMDCKRGERCRDFYTMMLLIPKLRSANSIIQRGISKEVPSHCETSYPSFFWKVYMDRDDTSDFDVKPDLLDGLEADTKFKGE